AMLDANLRGAEHVAGGMKTDVHVADASSLAVRKRVDVRVGQPAPQHEFAGRRAQIGGRPRMRVVAVGVRDQGTIDRQPGVDVKPARLAVESRGSLDDHAVRYGSMAAA